MSQYSIEQFSKITGLNKILIRTWENRYGFLKPKRTNTNIRFYDNHNDAVDAGVPMAKERVGPNAKLKKEYATWDEGLKDARQCGGAGGGMSAGGSQAGGAGDHAVGSCSSPKYNEFFVFNNLVILCQGENEIESRSNCIDVIEILKIKEN